MKIAFAPTFLRGAVSSTVASAFGTASVLAVVAGGAYIFDCRLSGGTADRCWLTGLPLMGIGGAAGGSFRMGYNTYNPALRTNEADASTAPTEPTMEGPPEPPDGPAPPTAKRRTTSRR